MMRQLWLVLPLVVAACAGPGDLAGPVPDGLGDAKALASGTAALVTARLPRAASVRVEGAPPESLAPALAGELRHAGLAVSESEQPKQPGSPVVRYAVIPQPEGAVVRISIDGEVAGARFFSRTATGAMQVAGPLTVVRTEAAR